MGKEIANILLQGLSTNGLRAFYIPCLLPDHRFFSHIPGIKIFGSVPVLGHINS
jgi:hypothetical protein